MKKTIDFNDETAINFIEKLASNTLKNKISWQKTENKFCGEPMFNTYYTELKIAKLNNRSLTVTLEHNVKQDTNTLTIYFTDEPDAVFSYNTTPVVNKLDYSFLPKALYNLEKALYEYENRTFNQKIDIIRTCLFDYVNEKPNIDTGILDGKEVSLFDGV